MWPWDIFNNPIWCLYDGKGGEVILKHPWRAGQQVPCPHCGKKLRLKDRRAQCCKQEFEATFGEIRQLAPAATHELKSGRGWISLRPYKQAQKSAGRMRPDLTYNIDKRRKA